MTNGEKAWQNKTNGLDQLHYLSDSLTAPLYNMVFFICDSFGKRKMMARAGTNFFMTSKRCWFYTCLSSRTSWGSLEFLKLLLRFEKTGIQCAKRILGSGVVIQYSDALESILGFLTSNYQADWHLQASTGRLFTLQPPFFVLYIYGQVLSGGRKHNGTWKPL